MLLGVFVLAKAADYWLDRFDLVSQSGGLVTGMTYTDDHAVLPAKNILMGIAVICAVLFFLNVWRRTWLLPSVGLALLVLSAILLGLIWPGIVQQFQVKPSEADRGQPYISKNIEATRAAYDLGKVETTPYTDDTSVATGKLPQLDAQTASVPACRPAARAADVRAEPAGALVLLGRRGARRRRYKIDGTDWALVLGVRELNQSGINSSDRNWSNLHTVYTHGNGVIAAYANQRPSTTRPWDQHPVGRGYPTPDEPEAQHALGEVRDAGLLRRAEPRLLDRRQDAGLAGRGAQPAGHRHDG